MKKVLVSFVFGVLFGVLGIFGQQVSPTYAAVRAQQDSLPEIFFSLVQNWKDCRRLFEQARSLAKGSAERAQKIAELRNSFNQSCKYRYDFATAASSALYFRYLTAEELANTGWTRQQVKDIGKWWEKLKDYMAKFKGLDKSGPTYDQVSDFLAKA